MGDHMEYVVEHQSALRLKIHSPVLGTTLERGTSVMVQIPPEKLVIVPDEAP